VGQRGPEEMDVEGAVEDDGLDVVGVESAGQ
jgi:hypothetical protein